MTDVMPTTINRTLRRLPNAAYRTREYLTEAEVEQLVEAARKRGRNGARDAAAILLAYRHGLRAQELCSLRWSQLDLRHGRLHVNRATSSITKSLRKGERLAVFMRTNTPCPSCAGIGRSLRL
jgi:integrase